MFTEHRPERLCRIGFITAITAGFYLCSHYSYLLFHSLVEITTIAIGFTLFILAWNTRRFMTNDSLKLLGIGYGFIALIDLLHTLSYKGMNVFPGYDANLPTQLWIAARYLQAATLCVAAGFAGRRISEYRLFGIFSLAVAVLMALVYSGNFPDCFVEGKGLTAFKIASEYAITAILIAALIGFHRVRAHFNDTVYALIVASILCTAGAELSFTAYVSVFGFANMLGHLLKLAAFYLIYRALLVIGFKEPYELIFRDLTKAEAALQQAYDTLEEKIRERTAELEATNCELEEEISARQQTEEALRLQAVELEEEMEKRQKTQDELEKMNELLEQRVQERTAELTATNAELARLNKIFVGRELKMIELKEKIRELEKCSGGGI